MATFPQKDELYLHFNGLDNYVEIPSSKAFSLTISTSALTVSAWLKPDYLNFPHAEGTGYVHWMGKGGPGEQEWVCRMYSYDNIETPPRPNRISFYVFNPDGGLGVGSYFQDPVTRGQWIHVAGIAGPAQTYIYKDGLYRGCDTYRGPAQTGCPSHKAPGTQEPLIINPRAGSAPLRIGTRDFASFFKGGMSKVRIWNRAISAEEIQALFANDAVPGHGLVAEYRFDKNTGSVATDTTGRYDGMIIGAKWMEQQI